MRKYCFVFLLSLTGLMPISGIADTTVAESVIDKAIEGGFTELEKQIIEKYFKNKNDDGDSKDNKNQKKDNKKGLPKGLAKKEKLPPGLAKQLERNGTLPPGLAKRDLPEDLEAKLPDPVVGLERTIVDNAVVLVEKTTGRIVDILKNVVTGN